MRSIRGRDSRTKYPREGAIEYKLIIVGSVGCLLWAVASWNGWLGVIVGIALAGWTLRQYRAGYPPLLRVVIEKGSALATTVGTLLLALAFVVHGIAAVDASREHEAVKAELRLAAESRRNSVRQALPAKIAGWRDDLAKGIDESDEARLAAILPRIRAIPTEIDRVAAQLEEHNRELAVLRNDALNRATMLETRSDMLANAAKVSEQIDLARAAIRRSDNLNAEGILEYVADLLAKIRSRGDHVIRNLPPRIFDARTRQAEVQKLRAAIAPAVRRDKDREAKARQSALRRAARLEEEQRTNSRAAAPLLCCDGAWSPSCVCGGSHQGCCSHHGGVCGCSQ
jgi:hypothetical protein